MLGERRARNAGPRVRSSPRQFSKNQCTLLSRQASGLPILFCAHITTCRSRWFFQVPIIYKGLREKLRLSNVNNDCLTKKSASEYR